MDALQVNLFHDVLNNEWLQNDDDGKATVWTKEVSQASWYENRQVDEVLSHIYKSEKIERWVEVKKIHVIESR